MRGAPVTPPPDVRDLSGRRVVIWGMGSHGGGLAAACYCHRAGARVAILERRGPRSMVPAASVAAQYGWPWHLGNTAHPALIRADLVIVSPAITPATIASLGPDHAPLISGEALFAAHHRGRRLLVTGTKGKSTTANACGRLLDWPVGGNSHRPLLDVLGERGPHADIVCELSSFQLWHLGPLAMTCEAAIITNLDADHLDWHGTLDHYHNAKRTICAAAGVRIHHPDLDQRLAAVSATLPRRRIRYDAERDAFVDDQDQVLGPRAQLPLPGQHNANNIALALTAAIHLGIDPAMAMLRISGISALPHRLQTCHEARGLRFIDDSIATNPTATKAALQAIDGPLAIILGGADKGHDYVDLAAAVAARSARPVCLGSTAEKIATALARQGLHAPVVDCLEAACRLAVAALPEAGGGVLLSPACASTDQFHDFADRGDRFAAIARRMDKS